MGHVSRAWRALLADSVFEYKQCRVDHFAMTAVRERHVNLISWARHRGFRLDTSALLRESLDSGADVDFVSQLVELLVVAEERNFGGAIKTHDKTLIRCLNYVGGAPVDGSVTAALAACGNVELLRCARDEAGCAWDVRTCNEATQRANLDMLGWLRARGWPWNESTCMTLALGGHLDALRWAVGAGCPWDDETHLGAIRGDHLEVLQWAVGLCRLANPKAAFVEVVQFRRERMLR